MFCNKCGSELNENGECLNCKRKEESEKSKLENEIKPKIKKKKVKKKKSGCLIVLMLIVLLFLVFKVVIPFVKNKLEANDQKEIEKIQELTSSEKIKKDFEEGNISEDKYVQQLAYEEFEKSKMDSKYKSNNNDRMFNNVFDIAKKYQNKLSKETVRYLYEKANLSEIEFSSDSQKGDNNYKEYGAVYAGSADMKQTITKVKLSKNNNFLIWYTDKGKSKVSDKDVEKLSDEIEDVVKKIEDEYNIKYQYSSSMNSSQASSSTRGEMCMILQKNNIDNNYLQKAMNIYLYNSDSLEESEATLAYYVQDLSWLTTLLLSFSDTEYAGVPYFPYIVIRPSEVKNSENLKLIYTHELFHHFQKYYCGDGKYKDASSGDFTSETTANWVSASINDSKDEKNVFSGWATHYVLNSNKTINTESGYQSFTFAKVYEEIVTDGKKKMLESMKYEDALGFLVKSAGEKFPEVMMELAKRNVTNEYEHQTFKAYKLPKNTKKLSESYQKNEENVLGYAMNYYYIEKANFKNNTYIDISSENNLNYVIIGRKNVVGLKSNNYSEIKRGSLRKDSLEIETQKYFEDYDQIIIAIINPNKPSLRYNINCMRENFFKLVSADDMTNREKREEIYQKNDYIEIKIKDIKELLNSIINIGEAGIQDGDNESVRSQISNAMEELNNENIQLDKFNTVRIYELDLGKISLTEDVNDRIKKMYSGLTFKVFDKTNPQGLRICVGVNIGALSKNKFNFYLVFTDDAGNANAYLVEILEN